MKTYRFKTILLALFCFSGFYANAQTWDWATHGNLGKRYYVNVVADQNGYVYAAGNDSIGFVLTKYKPNGVKIWSKTDSVTEVQKLSIDAAGNLYIAAESRLTGGFSPTLIITAKLDSAGNRIWTKGVVAHLSPTDGPTGALFAGAADAAGNTYMAGLFKNISGVTQFDTIALGTLAPDNYFLAKYNTAGKIQWLRFFNEPVLAIASGPQESYYLEGGTYFRKYAANGTLIWQQNFTGTFNPSIPHGVWNKLESDAQGNLYVLGYGSNNKLAKYNSNGTLAWAKTTQSMPFTSKNFSLSNTGNVLVTGTFSGNTPFGNGVPNLLSNATEGSLFVAQFSGADGSADWAKPAGTPTAISGEAIVSLPNGSQVIAGNFKGGSTFDQLSVPGKGFFIAKLSGTTLGIAEHQSASDDLQLYPNPAATEVILRSKAKNSNLEIFNLTGQRIYESAFTSETKLNIAGYPAGLYIIKITSAGKTETRKLLVNH